MNLLWKRFIAGFERKHTIWLVAVFLAGALALYWDHTQPPREANPKTPEALDAADTLIPEGFVLVPIEVANYESLDSILGKFGVVDLYVPPAQPGGRPIRVASRIKILRAPLNPSHFAVLAPEEKSSDLVRHGGAFLVVVQNREKGGTEFVNQSGSETGAEAQGRSRKSRSKWSRILVEVPDVEKP